MNPTIVSPSNRNLNPNHTLGLVGPRPSRLPAVILSLGGIPIEIGKSTRLAALTVPIQSAQAGIRPVASSEPGRGRSLPAKVHDPAKVDGHPASMGDLPMNLSCFRLEGRGLSSPPGRQPFCCSFIPWQAGHRLLPGIVPGNGLEGPRPSRWQGRKVHVPTIVDSRKLRSMSCIMNRVDWLPFPLHTERATCSPLRERRDRIPGSLAALAQLRRSRFKSVHDGHP